MPDFNFKPAITQINFYRDQRGLKEDEHITEVVLEPYVENESPDVFELYLEFTLSGLDMLTNPMTKFMIEEGYSDIISVYEPFYVYVVTYTQRGQRDIVIHGVNSQYISEELLKEKNIEIISFIEKFRNDEPAILREDNFPIDYDFVSMIYFVKIFYSSEPIDNEDTLERYMWEPYFELFKTKIPIKLNLSDGDKNGK